MISEGRDGGVGVGIIPIEDPDDPRFRQFRLNERGLASRAEKRDDAGAGLFFAEGDLVIERALAAGCVPVAALVDIDDVPALAAELGCPVYGGGMDVRRVVTGLGYPHRDRGAVRTAGSPDGRPSGRTRPTASSCSKPSTTRSTSARSSATRRRSGGTA